MNDLDLLVAGAMVSFLSMAGAYIAVRHRANDAPVDSYALRSEAQNPPVVPQARENPNPR